MSTSATRSSRPTERATPRTNRIIRASAGTGKTFQLSNRFLSLLNEPVREDHILATTFTRKAAGEILDRVLLRLADAALDQQACDELAPWIDAPQLQAADCGRMLERLARNLHRLRIGTLDSFFAQLARCFSLELALPPGWQIVDPIQDAALRDQAMDRLLRRQRSGDLAALVHALAKGEATRGVSRMLRDTVDQLYDLYLETDRDAWYQLPRPKLLDPERLETALAELEAHQFSNKHWQKAHGGDCRQARAEDWDNLIASGLAGKIAAGETQYYRLPLEPEVIASYRPLLDHARAVLLQTVATQTESTYQMLDRFHGEYRDLKRQRRVLSFADVTQQLGDFFRRHRFDAGQLLFRLDSHIDHLLLDEFQDTSPAQWNAVRPFALRQTAFDGSPTSVFCVGDVKQAIYGWRGGVAQIFDAVSGEIPHVEQCDLTQSFRSAPAVIDAVNQIFPNLHQHPNLDRYADAVAGWCRQFPQHTTARKQLAGWVGLRTSEATGTDASDDQSVWRFVAERVEHYRQVAPPQGVAVLVRTNDAVAQAMHALRQQGISASEEGGNPLTNSAAVLLIRSLLLLADHPGHSAARFHVARSPLAERLDFVDHTDDRAAHRVSLAVRRQLLEQGYGSAIDQWVRWLLPHCGRRDQARLAQLVDLACRYQAEASLRTADFVRVLDGQRIADPLTSSVRVMTVHQAKGLQFDIVILPELDYPLVGQSKPFVIHRDQAAGPVRRICRYVNTETQNLLPTAFQQMFADALTQQVVESLCVFYVAVTRAVHAVEMIIRPSRDNERSIPKSFAGALRTVLHGTEPVSASQLLWETGDRTWYQSVASAEAAAESAPAHRISAIHLETRTGRPSRGIRTVAPSELEGGRFVSLNQRLRSSEASVVRGTLFHAWVEQVGWYEDGLPDDQQLRAVAQLVAAAVPTSQWQYLMDEFRGQLQQPAIRRLLERDSYRELQDLGIEDAAFAEAAMAHPANGGRLAWQLHREYAFSIWLDDQLVNGSIDRLVLAVQDDRVVAAEIIDFKTDAFSADDESRAAHLLRHYQPQLQAYRRAMAAQFQLPPTRIACRLAFLQSGLVSCDRQTVST